jgi:hypothetical protein
MFPGQDLGSRRLVKISCGTLGVFEKTAESVVTINRTGLPVCFGRPSGKAVVTFALMVSLSVLVSAKFGQNSRERTLTEQDHL